VFALNRGGQQATAATFKYSEQNLEGIEMTEPKQVGQQQW